MQCFLNQRSEAMPIATDPFSLLFIACFVGGLLFLIVTTLLGNLTHGHSIGHGAAHHISGNHATAHAGHLHPISHTGHTGQGDSAREGQGVANGISSVFGYINPTTLILFLIGFGFFGYVFHNSTTLALPFTLILAGVSGFIIAGALLLLLN